MVGERPARIARALLGCGFALAAVVAPQSGPRNVRAAGGTEPQALVLLRYRLSDADLPAGWVVGAEAAATNAALAFGAGPDDRLSLLKRLVASGRVTGLQQAFVSKTVSTQLNLSIALYRDAGAAAAQAMSTDPPGASNGARLLDAPELGDGARATRADVTLPDGSPGLAVAVAWSRGTLFLAVSATAAPNADPTDLAMQFASLADAYAADAGAAPSADAELILGEDGRSLALAEALDGLQLPADAAPAGWSRGGAYLYPNDQVVLEAKDPAQSAARIAGTLGRLAGEVVYFTPTNGSSSILNSVCEAFASPAGASAAMGALAPVPAAQQAILPLTPQVQLGDETVAFKATLLWPGAALRDAYTVQWRRGPLLFTIIVNVPNGATAPAFLADVASALDSAAQAHPLPGP